jgi:hypothetical protein
MFRRRKVASDDEEENKPNTFGNISQSDSEEDGDVVNETDEEKESESEEKSTENTRTAKIATDREFASNMATKLNITSEER